VFILLKPETTFSEPPNYSVTNSLTIMLALALSPLTKLTSPTTFPLNPQLILRLLIPTVTPHIHILTHI
jgi:hypothetical protein